MSGYRYWRKRGMSTPWGEAQSQHHLLRGFTWVSTSGHGGLMITKGAAQRLLSVAALAEGEPHGHYLAYEEDCAWAIPFYELKTLRDLSVITELFTTPVTYESVRQTVSWWYPAYLQVRELHQS